MEDPMFEVTEKASEMIRKSLESGQGPKSIRILMDEGGWKGPHLVLALDEPKENDQVFTDRGVTFLVEKGLFDQAKPITIEYTVGAMGAGYMVKSGLLKGLGGI
jgi:iron-sulfur cluster assembly protein